MKLKRILSLALSGILLLGVIPFSIAADETSVTPFEDVTETDWFYKEVLSVNAEGIMTGKSETVFDPKANISRAEVVTALARFACVNVTGKGDSLSFPDTQTDAWYSDYVGWAFENGIVTGYDNGNFGPSDLITRQELAVVLSRMITYLEATMPNNPQIDKFADSAKIADWVSSHAEIMRKAGLMKGDANGNFNATNNASRAEVATIISRMLPYSGRNTVIKNGQTDYKIVVDSNESGAVIAAERFQYLIKQMTGADIEIINETLYYGNRIAIGTASAILADGLGSDGYWLNIKDGAILINGEADGLYKAVTRLANRYIKNGNLTVTAKNSEIYEHEYPIGKLTIQGNDISKYVIKYNDGASKSVVTAANEIQKYIEMACAVKLNITTGDAGSYAIILDDKAFTDDETFTIRSVGNNVVIGGSGVRGVLYGAYTFLDNYVGWKFVDAGVDFLRPVAERDISGVDYKYEPYFEYRLPYYTSILDTTIAPKLLVNGFGSAEYGGTASARGHGCHTFQELTNGQYDQSMQPCLSDPAIFDMVLANVLKKFADNPNLQGYSVSQNDNQNYCTCEKCMAIAEEEGSQAGPIIRFVNRIAEEVEKVYPDVYIQTLAYQYSRAVPKTKPRHNVMIQLCSIECCFYDALTDETCPVNAAFVSDLKAWGEVCDKIYIWDYTTNYARYLTPPVNYQYEVLAGNVRFFHENNVIGLFEQGQYTGENGEFGEMKSYLLAKLLSDPYMSEEEYYSHMDDFLEGYYGENWREMRDIVDMMINKTRSFHAGIFDTDDQYSLHLRREIDGIIETFDNLEMKSENYAEMQRIDRSQIQFDFVWLNRYFNQEFNSGDEARAAAIVAKSYDFINKLKKYKVNYSENRGPSYFDDIDITQPPNKWPSLM